MGYSSTATTSSSSSNSTPAAADHMPRHQNWLRAMLAQIISQQSNVRWGQELSGSLGDLGTFLPLVVALSATIQLDLGTTLLFSGLYNVASGVGFRIPMCVQPMKTVAAVALSSPGYLSLPEVMAAGLGVGCVMLLLGLTGAMDLINRAVPGSIVRGIQLAVGLQLAQKGVTQVFQTSQHTYRQLWGVEGCVLGLAAAVFLLVTTLPAALPSTSTSTSSDGDLNSGCHQGYQPVPTHQQQEEEKEEKEDKEEQEREQAEHTEHRQQQQHPREQQQQHQGLVDVVGCWQDQQQQHQQQQPQQQQHDVESAGAVLQAAGTSAAAVCSSGGGCGSSSSSDSSSIPSALILVVLGLVLTAATSPRVVLQLQLGPSIPKLYIPTWQGFRDGMLKAGLAQLPLTSLNSVIAVSHLALQLFPERAAADGWRWRPGAVAVSVGLMNCIGCFFGAMPACHGSGGLAAQYKFGARTGFAPVLLGGMKVVLALLFGSSLLQLLQLFPQPLLGALLLFSGLELAASARKETCQRGYCFMLLTAAAILGLRNTASGFAVGLAAVVAVAAHGWGVRRVGRCCGWWQRREVHSAAV